MTGMPEGGSALIRGGLVISGTGPRRADVRIVNGKIVDVAPVLEQSGEPVVDAGGLYVIPGGIDPHVHLWEPGHLARPDFRDETAAAALGGITTIVDQPLTLPLVQTVAAFEEKARLGEQTSFVDFGLLAAADRSNI